MADEAGAKKKSRNTLTMLTALLCFTAFGNAFAQPSGQGRVPNCALCHGVDGKGSVPEIRKVRGYVPVDLTQLSKLTVAGFPVRKFMKRSTAASLCGTLRRQHADRGLKYQQHDRELRPLARRCLYRTLAKLLLLD